MEIVNASSTLANETNGLRALRGHLHYGVVDVDRFVGVLDSGTMGSWLALLLMRRHRPTFL
ncbi:MAG: hypothetical protein U5O16_12215 [Rhodococcus sp. (in: high G+C Gram-positive bacteria)]|uniref:hypothetical protein n=1 Tax=Rhodococcus sp. TaxID=1831 RepID=UPI002ADB4FCE|nr:hypothetical protein [Rhodococcus sp. (in: high G+C Gram-positive bacteria)]